MTVPGLDAVLDATYTLSSSTHPSNVVSKVGLVCPDDTRDADSDPHFGAIWTVAGATYQSGSTFNISGTLNGEPLRSVSYPMEGSAADRSIDVTSISLC